MDLCVQKPPIGGLIVDWRNVNPCASIVTCNLIETNIIYAASIPVFENN